MLLLSAVFLLNLLPLLGSTWHRVLPEHLHVLIGPVSKHADQPPESPRPLIADRMCTGCTETRVEPGVAHLAAGIALQFLALASSLVTVFALVFNSIRADRILALVRLYCPPCLALPDPPPTCSRSSHLTI